jgi:hypothetical protein
VQEEINEGKQQEVLRRLQEHLRANRERRPHS